MKSDRLLSYLINQPQRPNKRRKFVGENIKRISTQSAIIRNA